MFTDYCVYSSMQSLHRYCYLHRAVAGIGLELDAIRVIGRGRRGVGGAPFTGDWMRKEKTNNSSSTFETCTMS